MEHRTKQADEVKDIRQDPFIEGLLGRMPAKVGEEFTDDQLLSLKNAMGAHRGSRHRIDLRGSVGFGPWRYYYVFLAGKEKRQLTRKERRMARTAKAVFWTSFFVFSTLTGIVIIYLLKSALGIDLVPDASLGLWGWFKSHLLQ